MADSISAAIGGPGSYSARVQKTTVTPAASILGAVPGSPGSNIQLQQAFQQRRVTSELLSTLVTADGRFLRPPQAERPSAAQGTPQPWTTRHTAPATGGDTMAAIRSAEDIIQAASAGPPSAEGRRIAAEAFLMEAQAQREFEIQQEQGTAARRQWMA